jgi:signal transduction histidine kinase
MERPAPQQDQALSAAELLAGWESRLGEPVPPALHAEADRLVAGLAEEPPLSDLIGLAKGWGEACQASGLTLFQTLSLFNHWQQILPGNPAVCECGLLVAQLWVDELERCLNEQLDLRTDALTRANRILREIDRGRAEFISSYSHELRTPLTAITGACELLLEDFADELSGPQAEFMTMINQSALLMRQLINDVLDFEKLEARGLELHLEPLYPQEAVNDVFTLVSPLLQEKAIAWVQDLGDEYPLVMGDAVRLRQILLNLVSNAIKFTPREGTITVRLALEKSVGRRGAFVSLSVTDTGPGIAHEHQRLIFDRFKQVQDRAARGTGLGLPIAKRLAELHGGRLTVKSEPGAGATFTLSLPIAPEDEV